MNPQKFYDNLRPEDVHSVKTTVMSLKGWGYDVFGIYQQGGYKGILGPKEVHLIARPREGMTEEEVKLELDDVVAGLVKTGAHDDTSKLGIKPRFGPLGVRPLEGVIEERKLSFIPPSRRLSPQEMREDEERKRHSIAYVMGVPEEMLRYETEIGIFVSYDPEVSADSSNVRL